jgi:hypothetical protein
MVLNIEHSHGERFEDDHFLMAACLQISNASVAARNFSSNVPDFLQRETIINSFVLLKLLN